MAEVSSPLPAQSDERSALRIVPSTDSIASEHLHSQVLDDWQQQERPLDDGVIGDSHRQGGQPGGPGDAGYPIPPSRDHRPELISGSV